MEKSLEQLADEGELFYNMETELVKQQLYDVIKQASIEASVARQIVQVVPLRAGAALDFVLADKDSMEFRRVAEGARIPIDNEAYTKVTVTPVKWGNQIVVSKEIQEDANWDVVQRNLKQAGREAAVREDNIVFTALGDTTNGFSSATTNSTSHNYTSAGTEIGIADIVTGARLVRHNDYQPNTLILHPQQLGEIQQIDTFVEADKLGSQEMLLRGQVGKIYGLNVLVTTTAWVGGTTQYAWVLDSKEAGVLVVRRPLTMKTYEIPERDAIGVAVTFREEARCLRAASGVRITVS